MAKGGNRALLIGAASIALGLSPDAACAAQASGPKPKPDTGGFQDIIVTANKRPENVQNVAIPVSALNESMIEQRFTRDLLGLGSIAPNLVVDPILGNGTAAISIRGIQLSDVEKSFDPPVGVFLDGVYLASTTGALLNVFDAHSVEVMRGPQGTLFGRNTIGGLLHVQRNKPTGQLGGKFSATYGRFGQFDLKGVINFPAIANGVIKAKVAATRLAGSGYFYNVTRNAREGDSKLFMISPQVLIDLGGGSKIDVIYDYIRDRTPTRPVTALTESNELFGFLPFLNGAGLGQPATNVDYHRRPTTSSRQDASLTTHSVTTNAEFEVGHNQQIVAVVNYRDTKEDAIQEFDGVAATLFNTRRPQQIDQFSAELRYQADLGRAKLVAGGYYFISNYNLNQRSYFFGGEITGTDYQQKAKSYAAFAQLDWTIVDRLTLTLGGRYLDDRKNACGGGATGEPNARVYVVSYGDCNDARRSAPGFSNVIPGSGGQLATGKARWRKFTPKVGLSYKPSENILLYGSYAEGFRSGGFNGRGTEIGTLGPYNPETVKNWELGLKSEWLDKKLILNLSAFHTKYLNKQEDIVVPDPAGATITVVQNAAAATIDGLELEGRAKPLAGLTLGANLGYLHAKYNKYLDSAPILDGPNAGQLAVIDKSNFLLRRAPKWSGDVNVEYEVPVSSSAKLAFAGDVGFKSRYSIVANTINTHANNPGIIHSYADLNGSVSYKTDRYSLSVFGRNLTGESHFVHVLDVGTTFGRSSTSTQPIPTFALWSFGTINAPTTYGVELQVKF